jgi:hypothetical protein
MKTAGTSLLALAMLAAMSTAAAAQPREVRQTVAVNPISIPFGTLTAEYERALAPSLAVGLSGWYEIKEVQARWAYAKVLVYPWKRAPAGLSFGVTAGVIRWYRQGDEPDLMAHDTAPIAGLMAQYNLVIRRRVLLGAGLGGRMALAEIPRDSPVQRFDADLRLVVGIAF